MFLVKTGPDRVDKAIQSAVRDLQGVLDGPLATAVDPAGGPDFARQTLVAQARQQLAVTIATLQKATSS